jgi:ABC-type multidrug transport system fused ATPase/permease subunit
VFFGIIFGIFSLGMAAPHIAAVNEGRVALATVLSVINRKTPIILNDPNAAPFDYNATGDIVFEGVKFGYPSRSDQALKGVTFTIEHGKMTAIVGASGSGKSTAVKLLERYYDPTEGRILIKGQDLKEVNLKSYRQHVGYVGQEPVLFNETIRENMYYCKPDATDEEILQAAKKANADLIINKLADGLDTNVGTSGG